MIFGSSNPGRDEVTKPVSTGGEQNGSSTEANPAAAVGLAVTGQWVHVEETPTPDPPPDETPTPEPSPTPTEVPPAVL